MALTANMASLSAIANDYSFDAVFARQLEALGSAGDVAVGFRLVATPRTSYWPGKPRDSRAVGFCGRSRGKVEGSRRPLHLCALG